MLSLYARKYAAFIWFRELMMLMVSFNEDKYYKQKLSKQLSAYDERTAREEWMTDSVIPSELFDVKISSVLTGFMRTALDNKEKGLTNIMNQVYDDNDTFIRTVLYEFMKG